MFQDNLSNLIEKSNATFDVSELAGLLNKQYFSPIAATLRSYDVKNNTIKPTNIVVWIADVGGIRQVSLAQLYKDKSYPRDVLNGFKDKIDNLRPKINYKFGAIEKLDEGTDAFYFRTKENNYGRVGLRFLTPDQVADAVLQQDFALLAERVGETLAVLEVLSNKDKELQEKLQEMDEEFQTKCDKVEDKLFPSIVDVSVADDRFEIIGYALNKTGNMKVIQTFRDAEKQFTALDDSFNIKPERYIAFAVTKEASVELSENFIIDADGNPLEDPDTESLKQIMEYHVVPIPATELKMFNIKKNQILISYNKLKLRVTVNGDDIFINDSTRILNPEGLVATNGRVFIINKLLSPLDSANISYDSVLAGDDDNHGVLAGDGGAGEALKEFFDNLPAGDGDGGAMLPAS